MSDDRPSGPTNPKDLLAELGEHDWDSALDEWERSSFVPEVTNEAELLRAIPAAKHETPKAGPSMAETPSAPDLKSAPPGGSVIAPLPVELRSDAPPRQSVLPPVSVPPRMPSESPKPSGPPSMRGGLNQLFSRPPPKPRISQNLTAVRFPPTSAPPSAPPTSERPSGVPRSIHPDVPNLSVLDEDDDEYESATIVADRALYIDEAPANRFAEEEKPTLTRASIADQAGPSSVPPAPAGPVSFEKEQPVSRWLDPKKTAAFANRIDWLEAEARATPDATRRARGLLAASEIAALVGASARALALATEARDTAPQLALAWRQARQLVPSFEPEELVAALEAEAAESPTPAARVHAMLLAADVLRVHGQGDAAVERWERAGKLDPSDVRAPVARAALALAQNDLASKALALSDNSELAALDDAIATALRLRGAPRSEGGENAVPISDGLRLARTALDQGDVALATQALGELARVPALSKAALWLSAMFGATHIAARRASARSLKTLVAEGEHLAQRQLAARGIELFDPELVSAAIADESAPFTAAERATLAVLAADREADAAAPSTLLPVDGTLDESLLPLVDALSALTPPGKASATRALLVAGRPDVRARATCGRLLAERASNATIAEALDAVPGGPSPSSAGVALDLAWKTGNYRALSDAIANLAEKGPAARTASQSVAAIAAELGGDQESARRAIAEAIRDTELGNDALLRIAAAIDPERDLAGDLLRLTESMPENAASAILRLEALARADFSDDERLAVLEAVHRGAPELGIGAFFAERIGRRKGDLEAVLRWIHERTALTADPLETALDAVREALLIADREPELASVRLEEAHAARPEDVALRELHERLAQGLAERGAWRERRAEITNDPLAWVDAALEYERSGDIASALRAARKAAVAGDHGLSQPILERGEIATGDTAARIAAITEDTTVDDPIARREAYERLVAIHGASGNTAAALAAHRSILAITPAHKPSLRAVEHALIGSGKDEELAPIFEGIAMALDGSMGGEVASHAQHASRLRLRDASALPGERAAAWERTYPLAQLAANQREPSLWALRAFNAHSRARRDNAGVLATATALAERAQRPAERVALLVRASEAAAHLEQVDEARKHLERAVSEDPADVVAWGFLAEVRERAGEKQAAAEACEALARSSVVADHQLLAWHDAARIWLDEVGDRDRGQAALEAAAEINVAYADVFPRLSAMYAERKLDAEHARLLERRLATIEDEGERVLIEVELARTHAGIGDTAKAKTALKSALEKRPNLTTALAALAELCMKEGDAAGAEQAYVNLARLSSDPAEQRAIYEQLAELYTTKSPNLSRAEVALREVLKHAPGDLATLAKLVDVYKKQGDVQQAVEAQQEIVSQASDPEVRLASLIEVARIYETVGRDPRRSEQVLDSARKEFPTSVMALRAMAEFYARHRQMPAMQILLDRAAGDARRAFAQGRFAPSLFQVLHAAFDLRGKRDAARVVAATLAAFEGQTSELLGAESNAVDPRLDELLAPDLMSPAVRQLLFRTGDTLDVVSPVDLRTLRAAPLNPGSPIGGTVGSIATVIGLGALQVLVSPQLGRVALPLSSNPPTLLVGEGLAHTSNEGARMFVVVRALKMLLARASATLRGSTTDVATLLAALFNAFNPGFAAPGVDPRAVADLSRRIGQALPKNIDPTIGVIALEAAGMVGSQFTQIGHAATAWANRAALLAVGNPNAALDALAWGLGEEAAPSGSEARSAWIARHPEARDLMTFSVTDAYAEARVRVGLDR